MTDPIDKKIADLCKTADVPDPVEFLVQLMSGSDPRYNSRIFDMIEEIEDEFGEDPPDESTWQELKSYIKDKYRHAPILLAESHSAARQIMEYTHAKKRQIDIDAKLDADIRVSDLTNREIKRFNRRFKRRC